MDEILENRRRMESIASDLACGATKTIESSSEDSALTQMALQDLKMEIVRRGAELADATTDANIVDLPCLQWELAHNMPDFELDEACSSRLSAWSLGSAVLLGWVIGGILSAFLGLLSLGGDILRAGAIFGAVWLEEYLATNSGARNRLLKICGWMALAGFASRLGAGVFRSVAGWRTAIFGSTRPGLLKGIWLCVGVAVIFVFFAHRQGKPDRSRLKNALTQQILQRLQGARQIFMRLKACADELARISATAKDGLCPRNDCALAAGVLGILDSLDTNTRLFLTDKLSAMGYESYGKEAIFIWDGKTHGPLYETLGIIHDGDKCLVLKKPVVREGNITKGLAQSMPESL